MRVYSPSATTSFMECPMWWSLAGEWEPRQVNGPRDLARILGRGFTAGMASYHQWRQIEHPILTVEAPSAVVESAIAAAILATTQGKNELGERFLNERDDATRNALESRVTKAVKKAIQLDPIPPEWERVMVEADLGEAYGHAKPDLVVDSPRGLTPVDYKLKLAVRGRSPEERDRNLEYLIQEYEFSWQMYHYCWALADFTGAKVTQYYIALVTLEPSFKIQLLPYEIDPESMDLWHVMATRTWEDMEQVDEGHVLPSCPMYHATRYGVCDCQRAVWKHHLDPALMEQDYVRRKRSGR